MERSKHKKYATKSASEERSGLGAVARLLGKSGPRRKVVQYDRREDHLTEVGRKWKCLALSDDPGALGEPSARAYGGPDRPRSRALGTSRSMPARSVPSLPRGRLRTRRRLDPSCSPPRPSTSGARRGPAHALYGRSCGARRRSRSTSFWGIGCGVSSRYAVWRGRRRFSVGRMRSSVSPPARRLKPAVTSSASRNPRGFATRRLDFLGNYNRKGLQQP